MLVAPVATDTAILRSSQVLSHFDPQWLKNLAMPPTNARLVILKEKTSICICLAQFWKNGGLYCGTDLWASLYECTSLSAPAKEMNLIVQPDTKIRKHAVVDFLHNAVDLGIYLATVVSKALCQ